MWRNCNPPPFSASLAFYINLIVINSIYLVYLTTTQEVGLYKGCEINLSIFSFENTIVCKFADVALLAEVKQVDVILWKSAPNKVNLA